MKFEIEADIPDGYEPTGEYRQPREGEWYLFYAIAQQAVHNHHPSESPQMILREKPLAYEDFVAVAVHGTIVRLDDDGYIRVGSQWHTSKEVPDLIGAIKDAADHVDRVNAQKEGAA